MTEYSFGVLRDSETGKEYQIPGDGAQLYIGRDPQQCDIVLGSLGEGTSPQRRNDRDTVSPGVFREAPTTDKTLIVSRRHDKIESHNGRFFFMDLSSGGSYFSDWEHDNERFVRGTLKPLPTPCQLKLGSREDGYRLDFQVGR